MAHFAKVENNIVTQVIVADQDVIDSFPDKELYIKTNYHTRGGVNVLGYEPLRKNFAGIGYSYNENLDAFIPPKPYNSWVLDEETCLWEAPIAMPQDENHYAWNEDNQSWDIIE